MNARHLLNEGIDRLTAAGIDEAAVKMEWWTCEALGVDRVQLDTCFPDDAQRTTVMNGVARLERHEPLQYVIGHTPFLQLSLLTDRRALIPRPETEELVMKVMSCRELAAMDEPAVADVGTGSGCIAVSLARGLPHAHILATDISPDALDLARANAARAGVSARIAFRNADLLDGVSAGALDAVVSNPPYIAHDVIAGLDETVRAFEPVAALDGGPDGLAIIRRLVDQAFTALREGGRLWLEIGDEQGARVESILSEAGFGGVAISRDMYGQTRFAEGVKCFPI